MKEIIAVCISVLVFSCSQNYKIETFTLQPINSMDRINDSTFLTDGIDEILFSDGLNVIADNKQNCLFFLDNEFNLIDKVLYGEGPEEIKFTYQLKRRNNELLVADYGKFLFQTINSDREVTSKLKPPKEEWTSFLYGFGVDDQMNIYAQSYHSESPILKMNTQGEVIGEFGEWVDFENVNHKFTINNRYLNANSKNQIINTYVSKPVIELWSNSGELITFLDLGEVLKFRTKAYEKILDERPELKERLAFAYYNDVYISNNHLYLLFIGDYEAPNSNQILKINSSNDQLKIESIYNLDLPGAYFKEIAISGKDLFAYDRAGAEIVKFKLP